MAWSEAGVSLAAHDALDLAVLEQLAKRGGFDLDVRGVEPRRISLRLTEAAPADAIGALLAPAPYAIEYRFDDQAGEHAIARVRVGTRGGSTSLARGERTGLSEDAAASVGIETAAAGGPEGRDSARRDRPAQGALASGRFLAARLDPEVAAALESPDPVVRAEAVADMETEGEGLSDVVALAESDPSPEVRAAAVEALGDEGTHAAVEALLGTLDDPDPQVLLAAIEALDQTGDETVIRRVAPLADHPSPAVREAAREALEFLE